MNPGSNPADELEPESSAFPIERTCHECGATFEGSRMVILGRTVDYGTYCRHCTDAQQRGVITNKKDPRYAAAFHRAWHHVCPAAYRDPLLIAAIPAPTVDAVKAARIPTMEKNRGLWLHGPSGAFKTTSMFIHVVRPLLWEGRKVVYALASEWRQKLIKAARQSSVAEFLKPYIRAQFLFLDDVGNMAGTGGDHISTSEEALKTLLECRKRDGRGILVTSQYGPAELMAKFSDKELGAAIVRRLHEMTGEPLSLKLKSQL